MAGQLFSAEPLSEPVLTVTLILRNKLQWNLVQNKANKMNMKTLSAKWWQFLSGLNWLIAWIWFVVVSRHIMVLWWNITIVMQEIDVQNNVKNNFRKYIYIYKYNIWLAISSFQKCLDQNNNHQSEKQYFSYLKMQCIKAHIWYQMNETLSFWMIYENEINYKLVIGCHKHIAIGKLWQVTWWTDRQVNVFLFREMLSTAIDYILD